MRRVPRDPADPIPARPHICHVIYRLDVGGLENGLVNLINHMPAAWARHSILSLKPATAFRRRISRPDVAVLELDKRDGKDPGAYPRAFRILRKLQPDVVHTRNLPALDMLAPAALARVPRLIHSEHGLDVAELDGRHRKYNLLRRLSRAVVDHYVSVSPDLADWLHRDIGVPAERVSTICNGVDTQRFAPGRDGRALLPTGFAGADSVVIGTVGRLEPIKDQATLVRAFLGLLAADPKLRDRVRLVIVGEGSRREDLERLLAAGGAADLAWLPGAREDTARIYRSFDVFVLPSLREGISNTLLEAMASGLPIVATRVGGNPGLVEEGSSALLVPPAAPDALGQALLRYVGDQDLRRAHGEAGRARALREFSLEAMVRGYARVYRVPR